MPYTFNFSYTDIVEGVLALLLICYGYFLPRIGRKFILGFPLSLAPLYRRPALLILTAGVAPIVLRLMILPFVPAPTPAVMEEFNNLLQAQTYAAGRLYNPAHPLAVVLQAPQIIQWPHYMSTRPPLAGLFLYLGEVLFGSPFLGNLLSVGLTSAALCWMMVEHLPRRWAALGAVIVVTGYCLFGYWVDSYWCPAPNILGAAVMLALTPRILRRPQMWHAMLFVAAMALIAGIRPYESGVYTAVILLWLGIAFIRRGHRAMLARAVLVFALPVAMGGVLIAAGFAWYDEATTGKASLMPYAIWRAAQCFVPAFLWQPIATQPIAFSDPGLAKFAAWEVKVALASRDGGVLSLLAILARHVVTLRDQLGPMLLLPLLCWSPGWFAKRPGAHWFILGVALALALLFASWLYFAIPLKILLIYALYKRWRHPGERLPIMLVAAGMIATSLSSVYMTIYFAVFLPPLILLAVGGLRYLTLWNPRHGAGVAGMIVIGTMLFTLLQAYSHVVANGMAGVSMSRVDEDRLGGRDALIARLGRESGRQLVLVRNLAPGKSGPELVWNGIDVDSQHIVWARDLRPEWSAAAIRYFRPSKVWLVEMTYADPDHPVATNLRIRPYPLDRLPPAAPLNQLPIPDKAAARALGAHE